VNAPTTPASNGWSYWKVKIRGEGPWQSMLALGKAALQDQRDVAKL
jgi:hypothetical protein